MKMIKGKTLSMEISEIRDFVRLKNCLRRGITIKLQDRGVFIAKIVPEPSRLRQSHKWPDFAARSRKIFGGRIIRGSDLLIAQRGRW